MGSQDLSTLIHIRAGLPIKIALLHTWLYIPLKVPVPSTVIRVEFGINGEISNPYRSVSHLFKGADEKLASIQIEKNLFCFAVYREICVTWEAYDMPIIARLIEQIYNVGFRNLQLQTPCHSFHSFTQWPEAHCPSPWQRSPGTRVGRHKPSQSSGYFLSHCNDGQQLTCFWHLRFSPTHSTHMPRWNTTSVWPSRHAGANSNQECIIKGTFCGIAIHLRATVYFKT